LLTVSLVVLLSLPAAAQITEPDAVAALDPINNSAITATFSFEDTGAALVVQGFAQGMDPTKVYVSLLYDTGSVATGPTACLPTDNSLSFSQIVLSYWLPIIGTSTRTLAAVKVGPPGTPVPLAYAPLSAVATVSVRQDTRPLQPLPAAPDPGRFRLKACGFVVLQ
jgi:hypothetical protein